MKTPISRGSRLPHYALIGNKLGSVYDVPSNPMQAIEALLGAMDKKLGR